MFNDPKPDEINNWVCVMERNSQLAVEFAKNYLANMEIPANILSKKDSAIAVNVGDMSIVYLYVPKDYEQEAREALEDLDMPDFDSEGD